MAKRLFVGNVAWSVTETELRDLFSEAGEVREVKVMLDRESGRPRGFAFVEMDNEGAAAQAINVLNGREIGGRALAVKEAQERTAGGGRGGGGFGSGGARSRAGGRW
jgi:cold-inducible RNA-binding protein